jgi:hypothetical protein
MEEQTKNPLTNLDWSNLTKDEERLLGRAYTLAEAICSVQPMPIDCIKRMYENSLSEEELIEQGYEPLDPHGLRLTWVKK